MAMGFENNPYLMGQFQGFQAQNQATLLDQRAQSEKKRKELIDGFTVEIKQVTELLQAAKSHEQRAAISKIVEQIKDSYASSPAAKEFGLDKAFARQLDLATNQPYIAKDSELSASSGVSGREAAFQSYISELPPEEQSRLKRERATKMATDYPSPSVIEDVASAKAAGKDAGIDYTDIMRQSATFDTDLTNLEAASRAVEELGPSGQGPLVGKVTPLVSDNAGILNNANVNQTLQKVKLTKGAISDAEMKLFGSASIGNQNKYEVNKALIAGSMAVLARVKQRAKFFEAWKVAHNGSLSGSYNAFAQYANDNPILVKGKGDTPLELVKPIEMIMSDNSWRSYIAGGEAARPDLPSLDQGALKSAADILRAAGKYTEEEIQELIADEEMQNLIREGKL